MCYHENWMETDTIRKLIFTYRQWTGNTKGFYHTMEHNMWRLNTVKELGLIAVHAALAGLFEKLRLRNGHLWKLMLLKG